MKFLISRTSNHSDSKPCEDAEMMTYNRIEIRTFSSFKEFDLRFGKREGNWLSKGVKHIINKDGHIQRTILNGCEDWCIEIDTLEELLTLKEKFDCEIIITENYKNIKIAMIEICDYYRE